MKAHLNQVSLFALLGLACLVQARCVTGGEELPDPIKDDYEGYEPDFIKKIADGGERGGLFRGWTRSEKDMKASSETSFFSLNRVIEDERANALVLAAIDKEKGDAHREALRIYDQLFRRILKNRPDILYRVSDHGVFVPLAQYVQRRILNYPKDDLEFYRTKNDTVARESFQTAKRKYAPAGFTEIIEKMLATSYGDDALFELGNAELDAGHYLAALDYYTTLRDYFPNSDRRTAELFLKIAYCRKMLGEKNVEIPEKWPAEEKVPPQTLGPLKKMVLEARFQAPAFHQQRHSPPHEATDDYTLNPPPLDPEAKRKPFWKKTLPASRRDFWVYTQPVATGKSIIYRHKNIIYARSVLTGELRWKNDIGGKAVWQNRNARMYPHEGILVRDGLVFTPMYKIGASLVAIDEVTGQVKWAYGPIAASNEEEARMRFESAPAGGARTVFATYILDNIEGRTHSDTEYGVIAFEARTGRIAWRARLCRLMPGKFTAGFANRIRNRIRSFSSPPLYHQGTVYVTTNAGAIAALDAVSGRIKWLMRYPYWPHIHDATRQFGKTRSGVYTDGSWRPHHPMFWFNQRPLLIGERLYVVPVDTRLMLCLDRRTGKVLWSRAKRSSGFTHFMGAAKTGELVMVNNGREVELLDPATGKANWRFRGMIPEETTPLLKHVIPGTLGGTKRSNGIYFNRRWFGLGARPYLSTDGNLHVPSWTDIGCYYTYWKYYWPNLYAYQLSTVSLSDRKFVTQQRYYTDEWLGYCHHWLNDYAPTVVKGLKELPVKNEHAKRSIRILDEVAGDRMPVNTRGPFMPFSRLTITRYGIPFELRFGPREVAMVFDPQALRKKIKDKTGPEAEFARGELAIAESRLEEAEQRLSRCLKAIPSEDLDFRARVNQQLFLVRKRLARGAIRSASAPKELKYVLGMSSTAGTLGEEIQTLFALAEANERNGDLKAAARSLRSIIDTYGHYEYPVAALVNSDSKSVFGSANRILDLAERRASKTFHGEPFVDSLKILRKGLPLYFSSVSPLTKTFHLRAGELASMRLARLALRNPAFKAAFETEAETLLDKADPEEQLQRLWEFPATAAAQGVLDQHFKATQALKGIEKRKRLWRLADIARISGLKTPKESRSLVEAPKPAGPRAAIASPGKEVTKEFDYIEGAVWLALERRGERHMRPNLAFFGARIKKRLDNKFALKCLNLESGKELWQSPNVRLKGRGQESGFFEAFVHGDLVVVHGLYDVCAFDLEKGQPRWRYRVPFSFEIKHAVMSGDLLILADKAESVALFMPSGDVAWQMKERGDVYIPPYFHGDRLIGVRKLPFNVTVRYRATGILIGRLSLPDLSLAEQHPLIEKGPEALPAAHRGNLLVLSDGWYYIAIDVDTLTVRWKRLIDANDVTRTPAMRFALGDECLAVLKEDYDQKALYVISSKTGEVLWRTAPTSKDKKKEEEEPDPNADIIKTMYSMFFSGENLYGLEVHPGNAFYVVGRAARTGKLLFRHEVGDYESPPRAVMRPHRFGQHAVIQTQTNQDLELLAANLKTGKPTFKIKGKGIGWFGEHGRVSATVQAGRMLLLCKEKLIYGPTD